MSFDAEGMPEAATGAILVANKIFWTLGYWQAENHLIAVRADQLVIAPTATVTPPSGKRRPMKRSDLDEVLRRAHRSADGSYRAVAARALPGRVLGGFKYHGTRPDDPNDVVPHEHRRELRALKVFGAWTNLVDMKAGNTLDTLITTNGRGVVRHYLQDVGSTFGTGANGPREYDEGWEYVFEGGPTWKRLVSLGFYLQPWQTVDYVESPSIGRFEGSAFDPPAWKPRVPTAAFLRARDDDNFWAARRVAAFSNEMIRALVNTGGYTAPDAAGHLTEILVQRRNKIAAGVPAGDQPARQFHARCGGPVVRERRRRGGRGRGADGWVSGPLVALRQHHRRHEGNRPALGGRACAGPGPRGPAGRRGVLSEGAGERRSIAARGVGHAHRRLFPPHPRGLDAGGAHETTGGARPRPAPKPDADRKRP